MSHKSCRRPVRNELVSLIVEAGETDDAMEMVPIYRLRATIVLKNTTSQFVGPTKTISAYWANPAVQFLLNRQTLLQISAEMSSRYELSSALYWNVFSCCVDVHSFEEQQNRWGCGAMTSRRYLIGNDNQACNWSVSLLFLLLVCGSAIQGQETQKLDTPTRKVELRWKFQPNQVFIGKLATGIRTINDNPQQTSFVYDFEWNVQSHDKDGRADVKVIVHRVRFRHRSDKVKVDYDSNHDAAFSPSKTDLSEIEVFLKISRQFHKQEFLFSFSDRGKIQQFQKYEVRPGQMIDWPVLPDQPVGVGDNWTDDTYRSEPVRFELVKLEEVEGDTIAWIENKSNTMRYRFLVNEGRYLDNVGWDILRTPPGAKKSFVQHHSQRLRLELAGEKARFDRLSALQPNQPGRALNLINNSYKQTDAIEEFLLGEKSALRGIQNRLFIEHVDNFDVPDESKQQWLPVDWLMCARYYERTGNIEKHKQLLKDGIASTAVNLNVADFTRNVFLLQFVELLADIGEFAAAKKACLGISPDAMSGLSVTAEGPIDIPKFALRNYALFLVAREQAKAGLVDESTSTAQLISSQSDRSAAHWVVAMHLSEHGKTKAAMENVEFAEKLYSEDSSVIEFDTNGPVEVPVHNYRTLSLGKLAICQAKREDENAMRKTLSLIKNPAERSAVIVDLIVALDKEGMTNLVDKLSNEIPELSQRAALAYRIKSRLQSKRFGDIEKMIETINEPTWKAVHRIKYCKALRSESDRADEIQAQLDLVTSDIQQISDSVKRASSLIEYSAMLIEVGRQVEAKKHMITAIEIVNQSSLTNAQKIDLQLRISSVLAGIEGATEFEDLMSEIKETASRLLDHEKAILQLRVVHVYLIKDDMEKGEAVADKIEDASFRCQALVAVGKRLGQLLELERSREVFAKAYESAMKVIDVGGLDTVNSKGGAVRFVGQQQGECDLEGLVNFLEESPNANIRAYGLIGGAEALDPEAAEAAHKIGRIPEGILKDVCESSIACKLLEGRYQPPAEKTSWANEKERP